MNSQELSHDFEDLARRLPDPPPTPLDQVVRRSRRRRRVRTVAMTLSVIVVVAAAMTGIVQLRDADPAAPVFLSSPWQHDWLDVDEVNAAMVDCLERDGWDARASGNGVFIDHPDAQTRQATNALDACARELVDDGVVPNPSAPLPEELVRRIYDERVALHACLQTNDFPVSQVQPYDEFLRERDTVSVDERWNPLAEVAQAGGMEAVARADHLCGEDR